MKNTHLILLTTEMYFLIVECVLAPDINLEGRLIVNNVSRVLQLSCTTNIAVQLCTVEFLIDKTTHDEIRYFDSKCYHSKSVLPKLICSPTVCMCSGDCKSFTLNVTITQDMKNHLYSCASKIENKGVIYTANISVIQDGKGSSIINKSVNPSNIVSPPQQTTTISPEIDTVVSSSAPLIIVGAASGLLILAIILFVMVKIRKSNTSNNRHLSKGVPEDLKGIYTANGLSSQGVPEDLEGSHTANRLSSQDTPMVKYSNKKATAIFPCSQDIPIAEDSEDKATTIRPSSQDIPIAEDSEDKATTIRPSSQDIQIAEDSEDKVTTIRPSSQDLQTESYSEQLAKALNPSSYDLLSQPLKDTEQLATALNPRR